MASPVSIYLAQLMGPAMAVVGLALILNPGEYRKILSELNSNHGLLLVAGLLAIVGGTALVLAHNVWVAGWPLLITIFGWLMVLSGLARLLAPAQVIAWGSKMLSSKLAFQASGIVYTALGAALCAFGYLV